MKKTNAQLVRAVAVVFLSLALVGGAGWYAVHHPAKPAIRRVYVSEGYGGFVAPPAQPKSTGSAAKTTSTPTAADPVHTLRDAYEAGHYLQAEAQAQAVIREAAQSHSVKRHTQAAFARQIMAYSAARRHDLSLARVRFAVMQTEAARLPDRGLETAPSGEVAPTLEAEAAFQHAVCTGALGDKTGAEAEYVAFMKRYPDSPLLHAASQRIAMLHGGDMLAVDQAVWQQAKAVAARHDAAKRWEQSLCGPECLAELLRRRGETPDVHALARQMETSDRGTTLAALASVAKAHGFAPQGLALTPKGLAEQRLPVIALVAPGHYVLVEAVTPSGVRVWDPGARGVGHADQRTVPQNMWGRMWQGVTLALHPPTQAVRTAHR